LDGLLRNVGRPYAEGLVESGQEKGLLRVILSLARLFHSFAQGEADMVVIVVMM
jgi:hypothetical protein